MKKPITLLITDTHLKKTNINLVDDIFFQVRNICIEHNIKQIIHLGDWFDSRQGQPLDVLLSSQVIIDNLKNHTDIHIIGGNHDKVDLNDQDSYLDIFRRDLVLYKKAGTHQANDNIYFHFLPFFKDEKYLEELSAIKIEKGCKNYLFTHIGIDGVRNNDGSRVTNNIYSKLFDQFDRVFVGHYHNQSEVGKNIHYIGSAYQANYGEDEKKGVTILYDDGSFKFIKLEFPKYRKIYASINEATKMIPELSEMVTQGDNVRVILKGPVHELQSFDRMILIEQGIDVKLESDEIEENMEKIVDNHLSKHGFSFKAFDKKSIFEEFNAFCENNKIDNPEQGLEFLNRTLKS